MLRFLNSIYIFCILLVSSVEVRASCDINRALENSFHAQPQKHSTWYEQKMGVLHPPTYNKFKFPPSQTLINVQEGSLSEKSLEPLHILHDSDSMQMGVNEFKDQFERIRKKPLRDRYDYVNFYETRYQIYRSAMEEFLVTVKKLDPTQAAVWEKTIQAQNIKIHQIYKMAKGDSTGKYMQYWQEMHNNILGATAELEAGLNLPGVKQVSLKLIDSPSIKQKVMESQIGLSNYPHIMNNPLMNASGLSKREAIEKWILSKEIDVVRKVDGKTSWVEVKRNSHFLRYEDFSHARGASKSYMDQILETKEILQFMGLDKEIHLEYLATGGMDNATRSFLESHGIKVLNP